MDFVLKCSLDLTFSFQTWFCSQQRVTGWAQQQVSHRLDTTKSVPQAGHNKKSPTGWTQHVPQAGHNRKCPIGWMQQHMSHRLDTTASVPQAGHNKCPTGQTQQQVSHRLDTTAHVPQAGHKSKCPIGWAQQEVSHRLCTTTSVPVHLSCTGLCDVRHLRSVPAHVAQETDQSGGRKVLGQLTPGGVFYSRVFLRTLAASVL